MEKKLVLIALLPLFYTYGAGNKKITSNNNMNIDASCAFAKTLERVKDEKELLFRLADKKFDVKEDKEYIWKVKGCSFHVKITDDGKLNRRGTVCFNNSLPQSIPDTYNQAKTLKDLNKLGKPTINIKGKTYTIAFQQGALRKIIKTDKDGHIRGHETVDNLGCAPLEP